MPSFNKIPKEPIPKGTIEPMIPIRGDICPLCKAQRIELFSFNGYPQNYSQAVEAHLRGYNIDYNNYEIRSMKCRSCNKEFTIDYYRKVHGPGITLIGAHTMARPDKESHGGWWTKDDDIAALIKLTEMGRINLSALIDEVHSPAEAPEVFHRLAFDKTFPLTLLDWRELE